MGKKADSGPEMAQYKKLGRGMADVSPIFNDPGLGSRTRFIALVNPGPAISCPFLACNLSICLARAGARVLVIDRSKVAPDVGFLFGIDPPYSPFQQIDIASDEVPSLNSISPPELYLSNFFSDALVHSRNGEVDTILFCMAGSQSELPSKVSKLLVPLFPDPDEVEEYAHFINELYRISGGVDVGFVFYRASSASEAERCFQSISEIVRPGPARPLVNYGVLMDDPAIERSILERTPLAVTRTRTLPYRSIAQISRFLSDAGSVSPVGTEGATHWAPEARPC